MKTDIIRAVIAPTGEKWAHRPNAKPRKCYRVTMWGAEGVVDIIECAGKRRAKWFACRVQPSVKVCGFTQERTLGS